MLFSSDSVGKGTHQKIGSLVASPFRKWKDSIGKFESHAILSYHKSATIAAENFLKVLSGKTVDVVTMLDTSREQERQRNRAAIKPIIDTIIFCGENELPLSCLLYTSRCV